MRPAEDRSPLNPAVLRRLVGDGWQRVDVVDETGSTNADLLARAAGGEDIAGAVAFLLSEDAAWVTGQTLTVDGGLLLTGGTLTAATVVAFVLLAGLVYLVVRPNPYLKKSSDIE